MKKTGIGFAFLMAVPAFASAQSSVTLYGRVVAGVTFINNTGSGHVVQSDTCGPPSCNLWGLKGKEDLGGGTAAIFTLRTASISRMANLDRAARSSAARLLSD
ncbi:putative porin [Paraburkholderia terricola]|uniref:porin n=1 Tax=Paraburkholderia terricola TaxID=169427 RepID=UPI00285D0C0F|nr:porin [Paraburkholderia terricola]MDR6491711.1 putative porin [Paraburkholderia terricola]